MAFVAKAANGRSVNGNALLKSAWKLLGHNGNVFLFAKYVAKFQTNKFYIFFLHILEYLCFGILHGITFFLFICLRGSVIYLLYHTSLSVQE